MPVVMAGMVGSNVGRKVAPYLSVPARLSSIGEQLTSVGDNIQIISGLCVPHDDNHNVMRGEEIRLIGAHTLAPSFLYAMPDMHCKWVQTDSQQINDLRTAMTGELHHLLLNHSLIGAGLPPQEDVADAFVAGPEHSLNASVVLSQLFGVRTSYVLGTPPREQVSEFLSSLLIGAEVASMRDYVDHQYTITLVAGTSLTVRYQQALQAMDCDATAVIGDMVFQAGARSIARAVAS